MLVCLVSAVTVTWLSY